MTRKPSAWVICLAAFVLSGCNPAYLFHAAIGQFRILHHAVPIPEALGDPSLSPAEQENLRWVARIKAFGEDALGLKKTANYETVCLAFSQSPIYTVSASPKDRLTLKTWWFPFVGDVPYLGFFDLKRAREEMDRLVAQDLDVSLGVAEAYSTLGWFRDPVTLNLLRGSTEDLAETLLHEMTHTTLYLKGQGPFNEGLAVLVGLVGASLFFEETVGPSHPYTLHARAMVADERLFSRFISDLMDQLERLYGSSLSYKEKLTRREEIFAEGATAFTAISGKLRTDRFSGFGKRPLNNATILAAGLYHRYFGLFESILEQEGGSIPQFLSLFKELAREKPDMIEAARIWLAAGEARHVVPVP